MCLAVAAAALSAAACGDDGSDGSGNCMDGTCETLEACEL